MTFRYSAFSLVALGMATVSVPVTSAPAFAANKPTYEQAWAKCKSILDEQRTPGTTTSNERYYRGAACMKHYGYSI
jgi:hypothetical protein